MRKKAIEKGARVQKQRRRFNLMRLVQIKNVWSYFVKKLIFYKNKLVSI
jgi:hypothetical protein